MRLLHPAMLMGVIIFTAACAPTETDRRYDARYLWGHEVNVVCPCDETRCYWVRADDPIRQRLSAFVERADHPPYTPVYLEFEGARVDETPDGFAADYDGIIRVRRILTLAPTLPAHCTDEP